MYPLKWYMIIPIYPGVYQRSAGNHLYRIYPGCNHYLYVSPGLARYAGTCRRNSGFFGWSILYYVHVRFLH